MGLVMMGLSHKTAPIELREHLTVPTARLGAALDHLKSTGELQEAVVLSTCNRLEVYARPINSSEKSFPVLSQFFQSLYPAASLAPALYKNDGADTVTHLFRVASGLDSMVVGETDVLGQVKAAYVFAHNHGTTGKITNVFFQRALFVGKSVRSHTTISEGSSSVGSIAVRLAERIFGGLNNHRILLLGAGKMAEITARHLLSQKAGELIILNRTLSRGEQLAKLLNGVAAPFESLEQELKKADIVIGSMTSDSPIISKSVVEGIMKARHMRSLYFIDIAVPRNVEPTVHELDNVYVYNIDDLTALVEENLAGRKKDLGVAEAMVHRMSEEFSQWLTAALSGQTRPLRHQVSPSMES
jgi:glutamyl-tRNA reductase